MQLFFSPEDEYKKDKGLKREDVKALQDWANKQPHLPKISESQIILFLHSCYFRLEPAKVAIENYFTIRSHLPEIFQNRSLNSIIQIAQVILVAQLPTKTPEGYHVTIAKCLDLDPNKYNFVDAHVLFDSIASLTRALKGTQQGHVLVMDAYGTSLQHLMKVNLSIAKKFMFYLQEALPVRLKAVHYINTNPIVDRLFTMCKSFIYPEMFALIHFHKDMESFYKMVPKEIMPKEYGGKADSLLELKDKLTQMVTNHIDFLREEEKQLVDESKRVGTSTFLSDALGDVGLEGSFKKLSFD